MPAGLKQKSASQIRFVHNTQAGFSLNEQITSKSRANPTK